MFEPEENYGFRTTDRGSGRTLCLYLVGGNKRVTQDLESIKKFLKIAKKLLTKAGK